MTPVFLKRMFTVFLAWVSPLSRQAKPRCMMNTRNVATSIHVLLTVKSSCEALLLGERRLRDQDDGQQHERQRGRADERATESSSHWRFPVLP